MITFGLFKKHYFLVLVLGCLYKVGFADVVIGFDDRPAEFSMIPNPYGDWEWNAGIGYTFDPSTIFVAPHGYFNGTSSPPIVAFNAFGIYPWEISYTGEIECASLTSMVINSARRTGHIIEIEGLNGGGVIYNSGPITLNATTPGQLVSLNWDGIDQIRINLINPGTLVPGYDGSGAQIVLDDFTWCECPEPIPTMSTWGKSILALLFLCLGMIFIKTRAPSTV